MRPFRFAAALAATASILSAVEPEDAFRPWSAVEPPKLHALAAGKIATATNASMGLARGISSQAVYVIRAPVEIAAQTLLSFDSSKHAELGTIQHHRFHNEKDAAFDRLRLDTKLTAGATLVRALNDPRGLQLSRDEAARIPSHQSVENARQFLVSILRERWTRFSQRGDLGGVQGYDSRAEIQTLLREEPKIAGHFSSLLDALTAKTGIGKPVRSYWDFSEVDRTGAVALGALYSESVGGRQQFLDLTYFSSGSYLASMALYELVPVTVNGKSATLVWHGCLVSSPELAGGFGIKRKIASVMIVSDMEKAIRAFRQDAERASR